MTIGYDLPTGILCLVMAFALSALHAMSSPAHKKWFTLPLYVRLGLLASAIGMVYRGVELFTLARPDAPLSVPGHVDPIGLALTCSMAFTFCALALHVALTGYAPHIRQGIERVEKLAHVKPHGEALATLALDGFKVAAPGEPPPPSWSLGELPPDPPP